MEPNLLPVQEHIDLLLNGDANDQPCDSCQSLDLEMNLPPWFDKEKYKRGQQYIWKNLFAQYGVTLCGLVCVLAVPSILKILMGTKKSSTPMTAYRRYLSTIKHVYAWYSDELIPGTTSWKSLMTVRARHLRASKTSQRKGGGHISQRDLVLTQFSFYGFGLIRAKAIGMVCDNEEDIEGYVHFWRTVGYCMGIDDRYNLCRPSVQETREVTEAVCKEAFVQLLRNPPEYFFFMTTELINGLWNFAPMITVKSYIYFTYNLAGVQGFYTSAERKEGIKKGLHSPNPQKFNKLMQELRASSNGKIVNEKFIEGDDIFNALSWYDRFVLSLCFGLFSHYLANVFARIYFNSQIKLCMFLVTYFPFLVLFKFGFRNSFVDMFKEDITAEATVKTNKEVLDTYSKVSDINHYDKVYNSCTTTVKVVKNAN